MVEFPARAVRPSDFARVEVLVADMFAELGTPDAPAGWGDALRTALAERVGRDVGAFVAVDDADDPVAVAVGVIDHRLPSPRRPSGRIGYVEWLATDRAYRRRGGARSALNALLDWFRAAQVGVVDVHASAVAAALYRDLGFAPPGAVALRRRT